MNRFTRSGFQSNLRVIKADNWFITAKWLFAEHWENFRDVMRFKYIIYIINNNGTF